VQALLLPLLPRPQLLLLLLLLLAL